MIYIVDIDNTICTTVASDYVHSVPITSRITAINRLYDDGHTIIYWTARGMSSGKDHSELTQKQLDQWGCKYHEVRMNKPMYDVWIDDKCVEAGDFFS